MPLQDSRWKQRFQNFRKAFVQLQSAVGHADPDPLQKQGMVQCFEYNFELAWKVLQDYLAEEKGYTDRGPRPVIERAFQDGLLKNGQQWLEMLQSRNLTSHLYDENEIELVLTKIRNIYYPLFAAFEASFDQLNRE